MPTFGALRHEHVEHGPPRTISGHLRPSDPTFSDGVSNERAGDGARLSARHGEISALLADPIGHRNPHQSSAIRPVVETFSKQGNCTHRGGGPLAEATARGPFALPGARPRSRPPLRTGRGCHHERSERLLTRSERAEKRWTTKGFNPAAGGDGSPRAPPRPQGPSCVPLPACCAPWLRDR